jgi:phosphocarrier protein FPr
VRSAGGTEDGRLGTDAAAIAAALGDVLGRADHALVLLDLGSAALSLEIALEDLSEADRARVRVSEAPLVEGAILAAVQASVGASIDDVVAAGEGAATIGKLPRA